MHELRPVIAGEVFVHSWLILGSTGIGHDEEPHKIRPKRIRRKFVLKCVVFILFARHFNYEILPGLRFTF